jgi:hypothetical protein
MSMHFLLGIISYTKILIANKYRANSLAFDRKFNDKCPVLPHPDLASCNYIYAISVIFISLTINLQINNIAIQFLIP